MYKPTVSRRGMARTLSTLLAVTLAVGVGGLSANGAAAGVAQETPVNVTAEATTDFDGHRHRRGELGRSRRPGQHLSQVDVDLDGPGRAASPPGPPRAAWSSTTSNPAPTPRRSPSSTRTPHQTRNPSPLRSRSHPSRRPRQTDQPACQSREEGWPHHDQVGRANSRIGGRVLHPVRGRARLVGRRLHDQAEGEGPARRPGQGEDAGRERERLLEDRPHQVPCREVGRQGTEAHPAARHEGSGRDAAADAPRHASPRTAHSASRPGAPSSSIRTGSESSPPACATTGCATCSRSDLPLPRLLTRPVARDPARGLRAIAMLSRSRRTTGG